MNGKCYVRVCEEHACNTPRNQSITGIGICRFQTDHFRKHIGKEIALPLWNQFFPDHISH